MFSSCILQSSTSLRLIKTKILALNFYSGKCLNPHFVPGHALFYLFYFILLDSPIVGRVTAQHDANHCGHVTVPPPMRDRPPHRALRPLLFTNSVWVL